jgi:hypothetical protein
MSIPLRTPTKFMSWPDSTKNSSPICFISSSSRRATWLSSSLKKKKRLLGLYNIRHGCASPLIIVSGSGSGSTLNCFSGSAWNQCGYTILYAAEWHFIPYHLQYLSRGSNIRIVLFVSRRTLIWFVKMIKFKSNINACCLSICFMM